MAQTKFYACRIGIKWATVNEKSQIKYTNHLDRATIWSQKSEAKLAVKKIAAKYPLAELTELVLTPVN